MVLVVVLTILLVVQISCGVMTPCMPMYPNFATIRIECWIAYILSPYCGTVVVKSHVLSPIEIPYLKLVIDM